MVADAEGTGLDRQHQLQMNYRRTRIISAKCKNSSSPFRPVPGHPSACAIRIGATIDAISTALNATQEPFTPASNAHQHT